MKYKYSINDYEFKQYKNKNNEKTNIIDIYKNGKRIGHTHFSIVVNNLCPNENKEANQ